MGPRTPASASKASCSSNKAASFLKPTVVGDTIHPRFTVEKIWQEGDRHYCRFKTAVINQRGETLLEGFHVYRVLRHEAPKEKS